MNRIRKISTACMMATSGLLLSLPTHALNIVIVNDDGFETANIQTLYHKLKTAGHDVIVSAPYTGQSGMSSAFKFLSPIGKTNEDSEEGSVKEGSDGVGAAPTEEESVKNIYYVDGTPVMAALYGLDVLANQRWGAHPDLLISGPNEGTNLGLMTNHSGTVGAATAALHRGVPAIAVSADSSEKDPDKVADVVLRLLDVLDDKSPMLPPMVGLNINLPDMESIDPAQASFAFTHVGSTTPYVPVMYNNLSENTLANYYTKPQIIAGYVKGALAKAGDPTEPAIIEAITAGATAAAEEAFAKPGLGLDRPDSLPSHVSMLDVDDPNTETAKWNENNITISVIDGSYAAFRRQEELIKIRFDSLFKAQTGAK